MNNLHRELAPISDLAWADIEEETTRTLKRYLAGRRVVDVQGPAGTGVSAVGTGHLQKIAAPQNGVTAEQSNHTTAGVAGVNWLPVTGLRMHVEVHPAGDTARPARGAHDADDLVAHPDVLAGRRAVLGPHGTPAGAPGVGEARSDLGLGLHGDRVGGVTLRRRHPHPRPAARPSHRPSRRAKPGHSPIRTRSSSRARNAGR